MAESLSKTEMEERWNRAKGTIKRMRQEGETIAHRGIASGLTLTGAAIAGTARGMWGDEESGDLFVPGTEVDADAAIGTLLMAAGVVGMAGDASDYVTALGAGLAGYAAGREAEAAVKKARKAAD